MQHTLPYLWLCMSRDTHSLVLTCSLIVTLQQIVYPIVMKESWRLHRHIFLGKWLVTNVYCFAIDACSTPLTLVNSLWTKLLPFCIMRNANDRHFHCQYYVSGGPGQSVCTSENFRNDDSFPTYGYRTVAISSSKGVDPSPFLWNTNKSWSSGI
jgi:hypothetical protein